MAFIPSPGVARVTVEGRSPQGTVVNVLHVKQPAGATVFDMDTLAQRAWDAWELNVLPVLSSSYTLVQVRAALMDTDESPVGTYGESPQPTGGATGEFLPAGAAAVVTLRTGARGRSGRGRMYLGPLPEGQVANGEMLPAYVDAVQLGVEGFRADLASDGWNLGVLSQYSGGAPRAEGLFRPVTGIVIRSPRPGYQERRTGRS